MNQPINLLIIKERDSCFSKYQSQGRKDEDLHIVTSMMNKINERKSSNRKGYFPNLSNQLNDKCLNPKKILEPFEILCFHYIQAYFLSFLNCSGINISLFYSLRIKLLLLPFCNISYNPFLFQPVFFFCVPIDNLKHVLYAALLLP